jgi:hypothetical protein
VDEIFGRENSRSKGKSKEDSMKFAASVKKVIAFLLCLALLTSDVTVTNATSVDTTDVFTEISTEMLNETKNAGQESTGQEGKMSDPDGTGNTEKVRNTEMK